MITGGHPVKMQYSRLTFSVSLNSYEVPKETGYHLPWQG